MDYVFRSKYYRLRKRDWDKTFQVGHIRLESWIFLSSGTNFFIWTFWNDQDSLISYLLKRGMSCEISGGTFSAALNEIGPWLAAPYTCSDTVKPTAVP